VHELFEEQAARAPGRTAVTDGTRRLSYAELDARAAGLAGRLARRGVRPGCLAGIYLSRGTEMIVAILATLKAGAGYLMLDPEFPAARLRAMARDAGVVLIVADSAAARELAVAPVLLMRPGEDGDPSWRPGGRRARPDDVACVMFTSGSTARPKAVAAPHSAIVATLTGQDFLRFAPDSVWLQCAPVSWDAFALELWGALLSGGTCVLQPGQLPDPQRIERLAAAHHITTMYLSAGLFNVIVDEYPAALASLRELMTGGETVSAAHIRRAMSLHPGLRIVNGYGPVEATIIVTAHQVPRDHPARRPVPIGRPLAGKTALVLDARLRPVPDGGTGELYAAGAGLARGYLGQPGLTAERFVASPAGPPGSRMYRTGDLARWHAGAPLDILGRADRQVKIRGFRIEPSEVEAVLAGHPGVRRAAVAADLEPGGGDGRLVGYVVARGEDAPAAAELREYAAARLPGFMVPWPIVTLDSLPLTSNGKLDTAALPAPPPVPPPASAARREPASEAERVLCELLAEVLGVPVPGPDDSLFALGGNSLHVTRLMSRVRHAFGAEISARQVFAGPTAAAIARRVGPVPAAVPNRDVARRSGAAGAADGAGLSFAQHRLWFLDRVDAGVAYTMPLLIRIRGELDAGALRAALDDVAGRHESLRTVYPERDGEPVLRVLSGAGARVPFTVIRGTPAQCEAAIAAAAAHRFDLSAELPVRATLASEDGGGRHALLLALHHIAADGWSLAPLFRDLSHAYAARRDGRAPELAAVPGYAARAARQREVLGDPDDPDSVLARQLRYWARTLHGLPASLSLPRLPARPGADGQAAATVVRRLGPVPHAEMVNLARRHGGTPFMVLHAALVAVLRLAGAGDDIAIGAPVAGRRDLAEEDIVGFFVNLLVLRTALPADPTVSGLLDLVRDTDLEAFAHQDVPFQHVVGELNPARAPGRNPLTDVVLAVQNNAHAELRLPGTQARPEVLRTGAARFELLVDVSEEYGPDGTPGGAELVVEYQAGAFGRSVMTWLADCLTAILPAMAAAPGARLSGIGGLPELPAGAREAIRAREPAAVPAAASPAPGSGLEQRLAAIWAAVLGVPEVGVDDDFFALGGSSLRAVRAAARIAATERLTVAAAQIFATPTVAGLARALLSAPAMPEPAIPRLPRGQQQAAAAPSRR
jgi:amino acid adenylation domain-containing protein